MNTTMLLASLLCVKLICCLIGYVVRMKLNNDEICITLIMETVLFTRDCMKEENERYGNADWLGVTEGCGYE